MVSARDGKGGWMRAGCDQNKRMVPGVPSGQCTHATPPPLVLKSPWLPATVKTGSSEMIGCSPFKNWLPTVGEFCAGTCAYHPRLYGEPGPTKVLQGPTVNSFVIGTAVINTHTVTFFSAGTHRCQPKVGDPQMPQRGPRDDL